MPITLNHEGGDVYRLDVRGILHKADLDRCQKTLAAHMDRQGPVRLLFVLTAFAGWERQADWNDMSFYMDRGDAIERIAIVGEEGWRQDALMFAAADLRRAMVKFFPAGDSAVAAAREWLSAVPVPPTST